MKVLAIVLIDIFLSFCCIEAQDFNNAIEKSRQLVENFRTTENIPGIVAGISYKGKQVWVESFGYSDIENDVKCRTDTVMRTGSVTKPINTALVAKLVEDGKIKWDSDIHEYISEKLFPQKQWNGLFKY
jgi:CubicO group peptidase (beta-lactamase class C family)